MGVVGLMRRYVLQTQLNTTDAIRLYLFSHHYRAPWEFIDEEMSRYEALANDLQEAVEFPAYGIEDEVDVSMLRERFFNALDEDLDTPDAVEALEEMGKAILEAPEDEDVRRAQRALRECAEVFGLTLGA